MQKMKIGDLQGCLGMEMKRARAWSLGAGHLAGTRDMDVISRAHMCVWKSMRLLVFLPGGPECSSGRLGV